MPEHVYLWRMTGVHETTRTILCGRIVVEHVTTRNPAYVITDEHQTAEGAREAALAQVWRREEHGMELTGLWVLRDIWTGDTPDEIRALCDMYQVGLTADLEVRTFDVIAAIEINGESLHA